MELKEEIATLENKREDLISKLDVVYGSINSKDSKVDVNLTRKKVRAIVRAIAELDINIDLLENLLPDENIMLK
jgi:uncharacterized coiled-coil DUF342 family protein